MDYYSAESVIALLKKNNALICEGIDNIGCPSPAPNSITHGKDCPGDPSACFDCTNQACEQWIIIRSDKYIKMGMLMFKFVFSAGPRGRIPQKDSHFLRIKNRLEIDENELEPYRDPP
jgi:hypothetical protein